MFTIEEYLALITNEHADKQKFIDTVSLFVAPLVDVKNLLDEVRGDSFDLDNAVGAQLDIIGIWVGISRFVNVPLAGVYFSFDIVGLGFDQGVWKGPFDPDTGVTRLNDDSYRLLLRAKIGANYWDGTMETTKPILDSIFNLDGSGQFIVVNADNAQFAMGGGATTTFQLKYQGQNVYTYTAADLYKTDWQGRQKLYPTPRTNLITYSNTFSNAVWVKTNITPGAATEVAPDGTLSAWDMVPAAGTNVTSRINRTFTSVGGTAYSWSIFAKKKDIQFLRLSCSGAVAVVSEAYFDLDNLTVGGVGNVTPEIMDVGNGWIKCSISFVTDYNTTGSIFIQAANGFGIAGYTGTGTQSLLAAFADFKAMSVPSSYIPTVASPVTVTDYTAGLNGQFTMASAPALGSALSWTGQGTAYATGTYAFIRDNQDMTMTLSIAGTIPSALDLALITGGYINLKPTTVDVDFIVVTSVDNTPLFGFDVDNGFIAGFDKGAWGTLL